MSGLAQLVALLRQEGGLLAEALAGAAPDAQADDGVSGDDYALVLDAVREGYLLHYGQGRVVRSADPDLALLGGDRLYALGLERLAQLGDLDAVAALADLISSCAQAHADGHPQLADAAWSAAAAAIERGA